MKVWKWYKNLTTEEFEASHNLTVTDKYPLYAFTNNKQFKDLFRKMRKKMAYIEIKTEMEFDEYKKFANDNCGNLLAMNPFEKIIGRDGTLAVTETIQVLSTWYEKELTQSSIESFGDEISGFMQIEFPFPPMIFEDKYFHALYKLQYVDYWKLYTNRKITGLEEEMLENLGIDLDYSYPEMEFDEFGVFVYLFGQYMKL